MQTEPHHPQPGDRTRGVRYSSLDRMISCCEDDPNSCAGRYCTEQDEDGDLHLYFWPPDTKHGFVSIPLRGVTAWSYVEEPSGHLTVSPSIFLNPTGTPPGWHGFLQNGCWLTV